MARRGRAERGSIRNRILAVYSAALLSMVLIFMPLANRLTNRLLGETAVQHTEQTLSQAAAALDRYVADIRHISDYLVAHRILLQTLREPSVENREAVERLLALSRDFRPDVVSILLFTPDGQFYSAERGLRLNTNWSYRDMPWYMEAVGARGEPCLSASYVSHAVRGRYPWVVSLSRAIFIHGELRGVLLMELSFDRMEAICSDLQLDNDGYVFLVDQTGELVYHPLQQLVYSGLKREPLDRLVHWTPQEQRVENQKTHKLYLVHGSATLNWNVVGVLDTTPRYVIQPMIFASIVILILIFIIFSFIIDMSIRYNLGRPLEELNNAILAFRRGYFGVRSNIHVNNELDPVGETFNDMAERIERLMEESHRISEEKRRSELRTLQAQIRPHFLYNTLESIIWTAELDRKEDVIAMTAALSRLLRATNADANQLIPLRQEMDYAEHYLFIQKMRYREKLTYELHLLKDLWEVKVLQLSLQPLIENAIYHGIKARKTGGRIYVDAWRSGDQLLLRVADDGVGFDLAAISEAEDWPSGEQELSEGGLGLSNIKERLRLYFGGGYGLSFYSRGVWRPLRSESENTELLSAAEPLPFEAGTLILIHLPYMVSPGDGGERPDEGGRGRSSSDEKQNGGTSNDGTFGEGKGGDKP